MKSLLPVDGRNATAASRSHAGVSPSRRTMRAARVHSYGGPEVLRVENVPIPSPGPGQVRVRVAASGVNPLDWKIREGWLRELALSSLPLTLGSDVSGVIDSAGPEAHRFRKGDAVLGRTTGCSVGTFAEYVVVPESALVPKPKAMSYLEAAALPLAGLAAHAAVLGQGALQAQERVLILGGSGGVGHLAIQLAKLNGAWVAATASRENLEFLHSLGADLAIEREATDLPELLQPVDLLVDTVGSGALVSSWKAVKPGGRVRSLIASPVPQESVLVPDAAFVCGSYDGSVLTDLARLVAAGDLRLEIPLVYPFSQVGRALARSQSGHARGKIVLSMHEL
jgi:NADPH:quinone reductase-like Zn-dependent oxidoreductase